MMAQELGRLTDTQKGRLHQHELSLPQVVQLLTH